MRRKNQFDSAIFEEWCKWAEPEENQLVLTFTEEAKKHRKHTDEALVAFVNQIKAAVRNGPHSIKVNLNEALAPGLKFELDLSSMQRDEPFTAQTKSQLSNLNLTKRGDISVSKGIIRTVRISEPVNQVVLKNCYIADIDVAPNSKVILELYGCWTHSVATDHSPALVREETHGRPAFLQELHQPLVGGFAHDAIRIEGLLGS